MKQSRAILGAAVIVAGGIVVAGPLSPPAGPVASTYKTLSEVEPRIAVNAANTPGDTWCLYKITQPGSYYLTGNIAGVAGKDAIRINANGVTLDLSGFTISGGEQGVVANGGGLPGGTIFHTRVLNGQVDGCAAGGVTMYTSEGAVIEDVRVSNTGFWGIGASGRSTVRRCSAIACNPGFDAGLGTRCVECTAELCNGQSFYFHSNCEFDRCKVTTGTGQGFYGNHMTVLRGCSVYGGASAGIEVRNDCVVEDCRVSTCAGTGIIAENGTTVRDCEVSGGNGDGISVVSRCSVLSNSVHDNALTLATGTGIRVTGDGGVIQNNRVMNNNNWGVYVSGTANLVTGNFVRGHLFTNFTAFPGNDSGQVLNTPGVGFINSNPWANFTH